MIVLKRLNGHWTLVMGEWGSIEYPITLGYTKPDGEKVSVVIHNSDQSEYEYDKMFELCGQDVKFSVD